MTPARAFEGKIALVTGGASGIGAALGEELSLLGATVVLADRHGPQAEAVAARIRASGGKAEGAVVDVSDPKAVERLLGEVWKRHGSLDYLFNNAGVSLTGEARDMEPSDWERLLRVNLLGVVHGVQAAYPRMCAQGHGHIVNTGSIAGLAPFPLSVGYATTKAAVIGLSTSLRTEGAGLGVKVSVVCPGFIDTPLKDTIVYRNIEKGAALEALPFRLYSARDCARDILRGVARNRAIIVTPLHAKLLWWLWRLSPGIFLRVSTLAAGRSRKLRKGGKP